MMKINKRIPRNIKYNVSFYISSIILTMLAVVFFLAMLSAGQVLVDSFGNFAEEQVLEDGEFTTYMPISEDNIEELEEEFDVKLEANKYINCEEEDYTIRVFAPTNEVNKYDVIEGKDVKNNDEVVLNFGFAKANGLEIGDKIEICEQEYEITGFFARPDYLYMLEELSDAYRNNESFGIAVMKEDAVDDLGTTSVLYYVKYNKDNEMDFRKEVHDEYATLSYVDSAANSRITYVDESPQMYVDFSYALLPIILSFVVMLIAIVLGRMIKKEQRQIGTLSAIGYRKAEIIKHYTIFAMIPGVLGGLLGVLVSYLSIQPMAEYIAIDFEPIPLEYTLNNSAAVVCLFIPAIVYILTAKVVVAKLLKYSTVQMLNNNAMAEKRKSRFLNRSKMNFKLKYILRTLANNKSRTFVSWIGVVTGTFIILIGFIFNDSCNNFMNSGMNSIGTFEYQYVFKVIQQEADYDCNKVFLNNYQEKETEKQISLYGVESGDYLNVKTESGAVFEADDEFYITRALADKLGVDSGETFIIYSPASLEETEIKVHDVIEDNMQSIIYTGIDNACEIAGVDLGCYNVAISEKELDIDEDIILQINTKDKIKEQIQVALETIKTIVYVLYVFGVVLCITAIYITTNMIIEENHNNISMLKVLGYRKGEINRLVLSSNNLIVPIGIVCSIPLGVASTDMVFQELDLAMNLSATLNLSSVVICAMIVILSYGLSLVLLKRKVYKVNMAESLKSTRE